MEDLTNTVRIADAGPASVTLLDPPSPAKLEATITGVLRSQLRIRLTTPLPRDAYLLVNLKNHLLFGEVVYCEPSGDAYEVALLIEESHCLSPLENPPSTLSEILGQEQIQPPKSDAIPEAELTGLWRFVRSAG
jgi:hypothetical protein